MELQCIIDHVFGHDFLQASITSLKENETTSLLGNVSYVMIKKLNSASRPFSDASFTSPDVRPGRLGHKQVSFDDNSHIGMFVVSMDRLCLKSMSNFSTVKANTCCYTGKWQFELQIGSKGVMQVGWALPFSIFGRERGVGDTIDSYAYDGNRMRRWNVGTYSYGESWLSGDIIGCTINLEEHTISYYRNGRPMGVAFSHIQTGPGQAYFPAVSLGFMESLVANFGGTPLRFPIASYLPLQQAPLAEQAKATLLVYWLSRLLKLILQQSAITPQMLQENSDQISDQAWLMAIAQLLLSRLAPLLHSAYIVEACLMPFLCTLTPPQGRKPRKVVSPKASPPTALNTLLDLMWLFLEHHEMLACLVFMTANLMTTFRRTSETTEYVAQREALHTFRLLNLHPKTRYYLLHHVLFDRVRFANFIHVKPLDKIGLEQTVATTWWDSEKAANNNEENKAAYMTSVARIRSGVADLEALQVELLTSLLDNSEWNAGEPSARKLFLNKFRGYVQENLLSLRGLLPSLSQAPQPITLCCFHRLLVAVRALWDVEIGPLPPVVSTNTFYEGVVSYFNVDRLGGVTSHLHKVYRVDLLANVREDSPVYRLLVQDSTQPSTSGGAAIVDPRPWWRRLSPWPRSRSSSVDSRLSTVDGTSFPPQSQTQQPSIPATSVTAAPTPAPSPIPLPVANALSYLPGHHQMVPFTSIERGVVTQVFLSTFFLDLSMPLGPPPRNAAETGVTNVPNNDVVAPGVEVDAMNMLMNQLMAAPSPGLMRRLDTFGIVPQNFPGMGPTPLDTSLSAGPADSCGSLTELLDGLIFFYHLVAHKQLVKMSTLRDTMDEYVSALNDSKERLETAKLHHLAIMADLQQSIEVFERKLSEEARNMAWVRAVVYTPDKQDQLAWLLRMVLLSLQRASQEGVLFAFVPDFYVDTMIELSTLLRSHMHPTVPFECLHGYKELLIEISVFLCNHFDDIRIVNISSKETLLHAIASFVSNPLTLECLEKVPRESGQMMVRSLLRPYEDRAWAQTNWVLVRFWQGNGFAFRYTKSPHLKRKIGPKITNNNSMALLINQPIAPCPSAVYQCVIAEVMLSDPYLATNFLNSVLNQLNWAFSEFISMLQEIQNFSTRLERVFIESRQLKICAACFDLSLALLRVLEMTAALVRPVFVDSKNSTAETLLERLLQLLSQVLNRVCTTTGCFHDVMSLEIPDLDSVDHFPIMAAVIGIMLALLADEVNATKQPLPLVTRALLMESSFQMSSLHFVLGNNCEGATSSPIKEETFSFYQYPDDVSSEELESVRAMIQHLTVCQQRLSFHGEMDEDNLCTICFAFPGTVTFRPCDHKSCRSCITRHLMNCRTCFFCKAPIMSVVSADGKTLHDFSNSTALINNF